MATASVKEALACGQYLCLCQFIREEGCIGKCFANLNCAKEKKGGQQRRFRISNTGNLNQISMKGVYQKK